MPGVRIGWHRINTVFGEGKSSKKSCSLGKDLAAKKTKKAARLLVQPVSCWTK